MMQAQSEKKIYRAKVDLATLLWRLHDLDTEKFIDRKFTEEEIADGCDFLGDTLRRNRKKDKPTEVMRAPTWKLFANQRCRSNTDHALLIKDHELRVKLYYDELEEQGIKPPVESKDEYIELETEDDIYAVSVIFRMIDKIGKERNYGKRRNPNRVIKQ